MIIEVKFCYRQTNRRTDKFFVCGFFLQVKFATSLLALLAGGQKSGNEIGRRVVEVAFKNTNRK